MNKMPLELSVYLNCFKQDKGITGSELCRRYPSYHPRTIFLPCRFKDWKKC